MKHIVLSIFVVLATYCLGQNQDLSQSMLSINTSYGYFFSGGDLKSRFGGNFKMTGGLDFITRKGFGFVLEGGFVFGSKVKEDVLVDLRTNTGRILGFDGGPADIYMKKRGLQIGAMLYKNIRINERNSGLKLGFGSGLLAHYIKFDTPTNAVLQISKDYLKGYDRLTRGPFIKEEIGWYLQNKAGLINGSISLEFIQGFTKAIRENQFYLGPQENGRNDLYTGLKIDWKIPLKKYGTQNKVFY